MNGNTNTQGGFTADRVGEITQQVNKGKDDNYIDCKGQTLPYNTEDTIELLDVLGLNKVFNNVTKSTLSQDIDVYSFDYNYKNNVLLFASNYYSTYGIYVSLNDAKTIVKKDNISAYTGADTSIKYNPILNIFLVLGINYIAIYSANGDIVSKANRINNYDFNTISNDGIINCNDKFIIHYVNTKDSIHALATVTQNLSVVNRKTGMNNVKALLNVYYDNTPLKYLCVCYRASTLTIYKSVNGIDWDYISDSGFLDCSIPCCVIKDKFIITYEYGIYYITIEDIYNNKLKNKVSFAYTFEDEVYSYDMIVLDDLVFCTGYTQKYDGVGSYTSFWIIDKTPSLKYFYSGNSHGLSGYGGVFITKGCLWVKSGNESVAKLPLNLKLPYYNPSAYIKTKSSIGGGQRLIKITFIFLTSFRKGKEVRRYEW